MFPIVTNPQMNPVGMQNFPPEGPKSMAFSLDFSSNTGYLLDLSNQQQRGEFSSCQTLYVDNSGDGSGIITITMQGTSQVVSVRPGTQGYYPVLCGSTIKITFSSTGNNTARVYALNVPVAPGQWQTS